MAAGLSQKDIDKLLSSIDKANKDEAVPKKNGNNETKEIISQGVKRFKGVKNNHYRFIYEYRTPVIRAENVVVLDSKNGEKIPNGKTVVYRLFNNST